MSRHDLPSGGWVELREPDQITEKHRRGVRLLLTQVSPETRKLLEDDAPPALDPNSAESLLAYNEYQERLAAAMGTDDISRMFDVNDQIAASIILSASFLADGARCTVDEVTDLPGRDYDAVLALAAPFLPAFMGVDFDTRKEGDRSTPT